ncbi:MAG: divalent cation transporter [Lentisphaeria bacterium]|nr:divalent cation transporter [Lentisphaeria bacterium]
MNPILEVITLTLIGGLAIPLGAILAQVENIRPSWMENELRHGIIALGGGALLSAVALVLVPEGIQNLNLMVICISFCGGALFFMLIDIVLDKLNNTMSQLIAMLSDFIPEAIALGAAIAAESMSCLLLAILMAIQNLPEGFNAYREMAGKKLSGVKVIIIFILLAFIGPIFGLTGYFWLAQYPKVISVIMLFAAGGILYIVFGDIAPQAKLQKFWLPPMGAIIGFLFGIIGQILTA